MATLEPITPAAKAGVLHSPSVWRCMTDADGFFYQSDAEFEAELADPHGPFTDI